MSSHQAAIDRQTLADALLRCGPWYCTDDDEALVSHARAQARAVTDEAAALGDVRLAYGRAARRVKRHHLRPPERCGVRGALARMGCDLWWRRQLRRLNARRLEQRERILGRVHDRAGIYVSDRGYRTRREQRTRNARALEAVAAINQHGKEYTLAELAELGLANPEHRRAELMLRIADTEKEASRLGHVGMFYTLTCPSRFHAVWQGTARQNPKWQAAGCPTPREAQAHLQDLWARARARLGREGLGIYGIRVVEPHHDGCPHWHMLLWCDPADEPDITATLRRYALEDSPEEVAGREHVRFKPVKIDPSKGSAAGYVAKYIAKNIDGAQPVRGAVEGDHLDHYGHDLKTSAPRIESWASTWGIRQFQFVGLPSVTVWREVRRLKEDEAVEQWEAATRPDPEAAAILADLRRAALGNRWATFVELMGGPMAKRADQPVRPWRVVRQDAAGSLGDEATGEVTFDAQGRYGEPLAATWGLVVESDTGAAEYLTRLYRWEIVAKPKAPAGFDLEQLGAGAAGAPWTGVNNCTDPRRLRFEREARALKPGRFHGFRFMTPRYSIPRPVPLEPLARWERRITESCRSMWPPVYQSQIDEIRRRQADDYAAHLADAERRAMEREDERRDRAADRQRIEAGQDAIIRWLAAGEIPPDDIPRDTLEALSA